MQTRREFPPGDPLSKTPGALQLEESMNTHRLALNSYRAALEAAEAGPEDA
jgi:hypothetical protein